jgi:Tfp pilus assembly protein PilX
MPRLSLRRTPRRVAAAQRGAAALAVVMVLFFVISLVAAYASRNLVFEQRASTNQYRSTLALETAEAGAEWALALLNTGRIDDS